MKKALIALLTIACVGCSVSVEGQTDGRLVMAGTDTEVGCTTFYDAYDATNAHSFSREIGINTRDSNSFVVTSGLAAANVGVDVYWDGSTSGLDLTNVPATSPTGSTDIGQRILGAATVTFTVTNAEVLNADFVATDAQWVGTGWRAGAVFIIDTAGLTALPRSSSNTDPAGFNGVEMIGTVDITLPEGLFFNYLQNNPSPSTPGVRFTQGSHPGSVGGNSEWTSGSGANYNLISYMWSQSSTSLYSSYSSNYSGFDSGSSSTIPRDIEVKFRNIALINRGTFDNDGNSSLSDVMGILFYVLEGTGTPACEKAIDTNDDGILDISDAVGLLNYLYGSGGVIPFPSPTDDCSPDPTPDTLDCFENTCI